MQHKNIQELTAAMAERKACVEAIDWAKQKPSPAAAWRDLKLDWRIWALENGFIDAAPNCPWAKLTPRQIAKIAALQPRYERRVPWAKLNGHDQVRLLQVMPFLFAKVDWKKLRPRDWDTLLATHPQFESRRIK